MRMEDLFNEIENLVLSAGRFPFTGRRMVNQDEILSLLDDLRSAVPATVRESERLMADKKRIVEEAQKEAQNMVDQAKEYMAKLVDEHSITRQAQEKAEAIVEEAEKNAERLRRDSMHYANDVFCYLEGQMEKTMQVVQEGHQELFAKDKEK